MDRGYQSHNELFYDRDLSIPCFVWVSLWYQSHNELFYDRDSNEAAMNNNIGKKQKQSHHAKT